MIFVKTQKTAGTSLEVALSMCCGPKDVITPIVQEDENLRSVLGGRGPQNFQYPISPWSFALRIKNGRWPIKYYNHISAINIRNRTSGSVWNSYYKFTIVRNPLDRAVSYFYWAKNHNRNVSSFDEFLERYKYKLAQNIEIISDNGRFLLDGYIRYESLSKDLKTVIERLRLPVEVLSTFCSIKTKGSYRPKRGKLRVRRYQLDAMKSYLRREAEMFGYDLNEHTSYLEVD